jgi:hypothetical protein
MAEGPAKTLAALLDMAEVTVRAYAQEGVFVEAGRNQYLLRRQFAITCGACARKRPGARGDALNAVDENARL